MSVLALRADIADDAPERAVRRFFDALSRGDISVARRTTADDFSWFGETMTTARWEGDRLARFLAGGKLAVSKLRRMSTESIREMPVSSVIECFGGVTERDHVVFADVTRAGVTVTIIAVTRTIDREEKLLRVLDPAAFSEFVRFAKVMHHLGRAAAN